LDFQFRQLLLASPAGLRRPEMVYIKSTEDQKRTMHTISTTNSSKYWLYITTKQKNHKSYYSFFGFCWTRPICVVMFCLPNINLCQQLHSASMSAHNIHVTTGKVHSFDITAACMLSGLSQDIATSLSLSIIKWCYWTANYDLWKHWATET